MMTDHTPYVINLILPAIGVALLAIGLPRFFALFFAEGISGLVWNAFLSALVLFAVSFVYFFCAYALQDQAVLRLVGENTVGSLWHFSRLTLLSVLLWAPLLVLGLSAIPGRWREVEW